MARSGPRVVGLAALALGLGACAYTTSTALLPAHLKTIAIPVFENATTEYSLGQELTQAVIERFVQDNHLKVVDERSANAVLSGKITEYRNTVFGFSAATQAQEYRVAITIWVSFRDRVKNRELWNDVNLQKTVNYFVVDVPGQKARTELDGRTEAIQKIADEILIRSVEGW
jgi:outer membrane lipopolysaccharide assembly protein LptE/RlpB